MPHSAREFTDITALLKLILNGYPGNAAILREYLQNSDDAVATIQRFVLDERKFSDQSLVDPYLKNTQGPALIAMNDGLVREEDWLALRKINSSSKQADASQTGKNGLGFRASYHITDNPHILSGRTLMIFDPHHEFEIPNDGGVSIDLPDEGHEYADQLLPFASYRPSGEAVDLKDFFNGTVFRLPLRTADQAKRSKIKSTTTSVQDIRDVFDEFITHGMEEAILFLRHITTIEFIHIDPAGKETCLSKIIVDRPIPSPTPTSFNRRTTTISINGNETSRNWKFHCINHTIAHAKGVLESRLGYDIEDSLTREKLSPTIEIAYPLGGPLVRGRLFTLLPIPQRTEFPLHLNAVFALDPNRQHLKNIQEVGSGKSRERFLVEWNKIIFNTWTPDIWARFLEDLPSDVLNTSQWSLWPPEALGEDCYWRDLITSLTQVIVSRRLTVFPTVNKSSPVRLDDPNVVVAAANVGIPFDILSRFGILIVQPPTHILNPLVSVAPDVRMLNPSSLHRLFSEKPQGYYDQFEPSDLRILLDYLVFSPSGNLQFIHGLPWFRLSHDGGHVSLKMKNSGTLYLVSLTPTEATIFCTHTTLLAFDTMSDKLRNKLSSTDILNVGVLKCSDISSFLQQRLAHLASTDDEILEAPVDHQWIVDFWSWIILWKDGTKFFNEYLNGLSGLFLLPTSRGTVRRLSSRIIHFTEGETFIEAWKVLGIYPISPEVPHSVVVQLRGIGYIPTVRTWPYIAFLIKNSNISLKNVSDELWKSTMTDIRTSLFESLPRSAGSALSLAERTKLSSFPVFMTRGKPGSASQMNPIAGYCRYVDVDDNLPLPRLKAYPNVIYVDMRDSVTRSLLKLVESSNISVETQFELLQLAVDNWEQQPQDHQDVFIGCIFLNSYQLPPRLRASLDDIPFVTVNNHPDRVAPKNLIHPHSLLSDLYIGEPAKMPTGRFCEKDYLNIMISFGFLRHEVDQHVVEDRIQYFASSLHADPQLHQKAVNFLMLLDRFWSPGFKAFVACNRDKAWIPAPGSSKLITPLECRDKYSHDTHAHRYYYDLTLTILDSTLNNSLRDALGWCAPVPRHVLLAQFKSTLENAAIPPEGRSIRLIKIIVYIDKLLAECQFRDDFLRDLQNLVSGRRWIPTNQVPDNLAETQYALFDNTQLRTPFCAIDNRLQRVHFLQLMGCQKRPPMPLLLAQLNMIIGVLPMNENVYSFASVLGREAAISILNEIATYHQNKISQNVIYLPCENGQAHPANDVYFQDVKSRFLSSAVQGKFAVHSSISSALAKSLGIPLLSSIALGDDDDEDNEEQEEQMGEDFVTRIKGFLRDYDPKYAITEFIANADDAWAKKFSLLLSNGVARSVRERVVSPQIQRLLDWPFLALHNDAKMSPKDMSGILKVGTGGKGRNMDTHGRHGLGALNFYYFTDVATIISDERVLILDPSGSYLPPFKSRRKRTATSKNLSSFISSYPDQLSPYNDLFGFSTAESRYNGTLIILPLCATITEKASDLVQTRQYIESSYKKIAQNSLFFSTHLQSIAAFEATYGNIRACFWECSTRRDPGQLVGNINIQNMQLSLGRNHAIPAGETPENWVIATSDTGEVPQQHLKTAAAMKMDPCNVKVQLAVCVAKVEQDPNFEGYTFSTVPLPKSTSLPFHLNARFAISSNRQNLVINSADGQDQKDSHTSFNTWILDYLIAPLYLKTLAYVIQNNAQRPNMRPSNRWWHLRGSDDVSNIVTDGVHRSLPHSPAPIIEDCTNRWITFSQSIFSIHDQEGVEYILKMLQVPFFVTSDRYRPFSRLHSAKRLEPSFVKNALLQNTSKVLSDNGGLIKSSILATLQYLCAETSLVGLPLLLLAPDCRIYEIPGKSHDPVYVVDRSLWSAFPSSRLLAEGYSEDVINRLISDCAVNIHSLTEENIIDLIEKELRHQESRQRVQWISQFWDTWYRYMPGPPSLDHLKRSGLQIVQTRASTVLPLSECTSDRIVYNKVISEELLDVVGLLGIDVVKPIHNSPLDEFLSPLFPNLLVNIVQCIHKIGFHTLSSLPEAKMKVFSEWAKQRLPSVLSSWNTGTWTTSSTMQKRDWAELPIWTAYKNGELVYRCAADIDVLPVHLDVAHVLPFMKKDSLLASCSAQLNAMIQYCLGRDSPTLSAVQVMSKITLPAKLTSREEIDKMKNFLRSMLRYHKLDPIYIGLMVPDQQGVLRRIDELYDSGNWLFSATLIFTPQSSFLHEEFQMICDWKNYGLIQKVDLTTICHCCNAIASAFSQYGPGHTNWSRVCAMSTKAFLAYQEEIPPLIWNHANLRSVWASLDSIQFVQRKDIRRQGLSYHIQTHYCAQDLPRLVAPSQLVLAKFEPVAWTQRGLFLSEPSEPLSRSNTALGVPSTAEVVAHLKTLTTVIALDHPGDLTLLSDIKETYAWLNDHSYDAKIHLQAIQAERIFLNVSDPTSESWSGKWVSAKEVVLYLQYDVNPLVYAREFLLLFEPLLLAAGCKSLKETDRKPVDIPNPSTDAQFKQWKDRLNSLRLSGTCTDVTLVPRNSFQDTVHVDVDLTKLRAHRVVLAAAIPHFFTMQSWKEAKDNFIDTHGTSFGAKAVLDFVYTGEIELSAKTEDKEKLLHLMRDLLEVFLIADEWNMNDLKAKIQHEIIYKHDMIRRLPEHFNILLENAKIYNADILIEELERFENMHRDLLRRLEQSIEVEGTQS
ncbi:Sacsin [Psilocybe cubensis]|uniref:BTB domain-containing protein n=2 Tax=Psilocybe cubensis TaxID=181762 RepID=A0A8H7Y3X3_PSICU|nr:Sacsin [Psilocybe cubensis]KAH9483420.1 Sacsin [Psilocybe cubensis]